MNNEKWFRLAVLFALVIIQITQIRMRWELNDLKAGTVMYQRGVLDTRNEAHRFIRCRVSLEAAQCYVQWIEKEATK